MASVPPPKVKQDDSYGSSRRLLRNKILSKAKGFGFIPYAVGVNVKIDAPIEDVEITEL